MPSPEEVASPHVDFYESLYRQLNPFGKEEIEAATIAAFLKTARGVSVVQLSQIWEIASDLSGYTGRGVLNRLGVFICFKLVAAIQQGLPLSPNLLGVQLPIAPQFGAPSPFPTPPPQPPMPTRSPSIASEMGQQQQQHHQEWLIGLSEQRKYDAIFHSLGPVGGRLTGDQCKPVLLNSQLPKTLLAKIWDLADMDADGFLDRPEFSVALHLVYKALQNEPIPDQLPPALVPPFKRAIVQRRMSTRSVEPMPSHPHPPPLTWSSRASSIASLNVIQQQQVQLPPSSPPAVAPLPNRRGSASLFERNPEEWRVQDIAQYEPEFRRLDTDQDGLVSGADVRDVFLRSGLAQQTLARIWAHVDVAKTGKLDLEQYAKCVELIRDCQADQPPQSSTAERTGTLSSPLARRDSQVSAGTNTSSTGAPPKPENDRVSELNAEIEEMQQNRRQAEQDLFQAEADLKVKNSEIRNLEIELLTLTATVKQLRSQRTEANKRLKDMDTKITKLEGVCAENQKRLEEDEARLAKTKQDIHNAKENSQAEEELLAQLRLEVEAKRQQRDVARQRLNEANARFEGFVGELTQIEHGMAKNDSECARMKAEIEEMKRILAGVECGDESAKKELLEKSFGRSGSIEAVSKTFADQKTPGNDPFGGDPFVGSAVASSDDHDPFAARDSGQPDQQFANFANFSAFS